MPLRRATPDDAPDLVRLRKVMYDAMEVEYADPRWEATCERVLREALAAGRMGAFVVEEDGRIVSGGVGMIEQRLAGPHNPEGKYGFVQSMATEPAARRRGYAREVFGALMAWFEENGVHRIALHATDAGAELYRSFGFSEGKFPELVSRR